MSHPEKDQAEEEGYTFYELMDKLAESIRKYDEEADKD